MSCLIQSILNTPWAMEESALETLVEIATGHEQGIARNWEAIAAKTGKPLESTRAVTVRDGVARVPLEGAIFPKANLMTEMSGATSIEMFMKEFSTAFESEEVGAIHLAVDSPGGAVTGVHDASEMIYNARLQGTKPIYASVSGMNCSAAYWISSAAEHIFASPTAILGSIGVRHTAWKDSSRSKIEIYSKHAPNKGLEPGSKEYKSSMQEKVNDIEAVFLANVARNRGISVEEVIGAYGQGGTFVGERAMQAGLCDGVFAEEMVHGLLSVLAARSLQKK